MSAILEQTRREVSVGMGQIALLTDGEIARAVLGSCVGLAIFDAQRKVGAMAHVVLPDSGGRKGTPGKFVDTALDHILAQLRAEGCELRSLSAKLTGGANMFAANGPFKIGQQNIDAARTALGKAKIRLVAEHLAGGSGRRITFYGGSGVVDVEVAGCPLVTI